MSITRALPKARKRPRHKKLVSTSKTPKGLPTDYRSKYPVWRVSRLDENGPFGWREIGGNKLLEIRKKLAHFEKMKWVEILVQSKHQNHSVSVDQICKDAQDRLRNIKQDDIDDLVSLRLSGKGRVWGIFEQGTLNLLWWDPDHLVCPSLKKHT